MGIDISSKLIVGLPYDDLIEGMSEEEVENVNEMIDNGELDSASPWYDSPRDSWIVGVEVGAYGNSVSNVSFELVNALETFMNLGFNVHPKVYCSPNVY